MTGVFDDVADRFAASSREFERRLREVRHERWPWPTPCTDWTVRDLAELHRFFAAPGGVVADGASRQEQLLHLMGRVTA